MSTTGSSVSKREARASTAESPFRFKAKRVPDFKALQTKFQENLDKVKQHSKPTEFKELNLASRPLKKIPTYKDLDYDNIIKRSAPFQGVRDDDEEKEYLREILSRPSKTPATTKKVLASAAKKRRDIMVIQRKERKRLADEEFFEKRFEKHHKPNPVKKLESNPDYQQALESRAQELMDGILVKKEALPMGLWKSNMQKQLDKKKNKEEDEPPMTKEMARNALFTAEADFFNDQDRMMGYRR